MASGNGRRKRPRIKNWPQPTEAIDRVGKIFESTRHLENDHVFVEDEALETAILILKEYAHILEFMGFPSCSVVVGGRIEEVATTGRINRFLFGMVMERLQCEGRAV